MITTRKKNFQIKDINRKSFLKNKFNTERLKIQNDKKCIKKGIQREKKKKNNLKLFILKNDRKEFLNKNFENRNYDIYLLLKFIKKSNINLGFNIPLTIFCEDNIIICIYSYEKDKKIYFNDMRNKKYKLKGIFSHILKDKKYQTIIGKRYDDKIIEFNDYDSHTKFLQSDNFNFFQILNYKCKTKEFLFEKKLLKYQNKIMADFARQIIYNEKYKLKKGTLNYIDKSKESNFIKDLKKDYEFILFFAFKIHYFLKIFFQLKFDVFSLSILVTKNNSNKRKLTIIDFIPFKIKNQYILSREEFEMNKEKNPKLINTIKETDDKLYVNKYNTILYNYYQKYSKYHKSTTKNITKMDSKKNIKKIFKDTYKIVYKSMTNEKKKPSFFKKKIDFQLFRHFKTFDKKKKSMSSKNKKIYNKLNFLFKTNTGISRKAKRFKFKFLKKTKILKKYNKVSNENKFLPEIYL